VRAEGEVRFSYNLVPILVLSYSLTIYSSELLVFGPSDKIGSGRGKGSKRVMRS